MLFLFVSININGIGILEYWNTNLDILIFFLILFFLSTLLKEKEILFVFGYKSKHINPFRFVFPFFSFSFVQSHLNEDSFHPLYKKNL